MAKTSKKVPNIAFLGLEMVGMQGF